MFDPGDVDRVAVLAGRAQDGLIKPQEKREMLRILAEYTPRVWDLPWNDALHVAFVFLGISELSRPLPADAS
jgi:hypothetical protein